MAGSPLEHKRFYCREWVFTKLAHCLEQRPASKTCGAIIVGGPGSGKTALCSELVWPSTGSAARQQRALHRRLLAYHFCQSHNVSTLSLPNFIRGLVTQLMAHAKQSETTDDAQAANVTGSPSASSIPNLNLTRAAAELYAEKVRSDPEIQAALRADALQRDPDEALKKAVLFPLLEVEPPRQCVFVLVDSLDEGGPLTREDGLPKSGTPSRTIGELLANHHHLFPQWLLLVVTARKHTKAAAKLFAGFKKISLDDMRRSQQVRDVQQYIIGRLDREDALKRSISRGETAETLNQLHIKCNGCFLYLEKVLDGVTENWITLAQIKEIPGTLNGLYLWLCQRLFRSRFPKVQVLLNVLAVSQQPLTRGQLFDCVKTSSVTMMREDFNRRFQLLKEVLVPVKGVDGKYETEKSSRKSSRAAHARMRFMFFHHSFAEWLVDVKHCTLKYLCSASEGHAMIAMWHTKRARKLTADEVQNFAYHLSKAKVLPEKESPVVSPAEGEPDPIDEDFIRLLWLIDSGAAVEDCLTLNGRDRLPFPPPLREDGSESKETPLSTPQDPKVLDLLVKAGAKLPMQEDDPGGGPEDGGGEVELEGGEVEEGAEKSLEEVLAPSTEAPATEGLAEGTTEPSSLVAEGDGTSSQVSTEGSPDTGSLANLLGVDGDINQVDSASGRTLLHLFAAEGDTRLISAALARRPEADLEHVDRHGQTPLNLAARHGHTEVVKVLLANGAKVDHSDCDGWTALRASAWGGHTEVVKLLLEAGAAVDNADSDQRTALRAAAWGGHEGIVEALLRAGADVNRTDDEGRTALIAAAYMGHAGIVEHLLNYGARINHQDADGRTALSVAALCVPANEGYVKVVNILLERGAAVDHEDKDGMTPLLVAAFEGHRDVCELLLESEADVDHADRCGRTPLWAAASMGHSSVVELLLFWGCYVDSIDSEGRTVLSVAAAQGNTKVVRLLLDRGLDEQHRDNSGWTPLHYAAFEGHRSVCEALLDAGARVDEPDNDGKGPLHLAAQEGHIALVQVLLTRYGAPPDQRAHDGKTPLRLAALEGQYEVLRALLLSGADVDAKDADGRSVLYILALENHLPMARFLLEQGGANVESRDSEGRTALHVSAWQGHMEMVALLLKVGCADVNAVDHENRTALHSAAWQGNAAIVQLLLEHGAIPDHTCNQGATALGIAAQEGHEACVRALLEHGADPNHSDRCGRNAVRVAAKSGHDSVVRLLEEYAVNARSHQLRLPMNGGSSSANSVTSGASVETKPSSAVLLPSAPMAHPNSSSPLESPDSTAKRRSFVSLGNHSSHSKSSSNLTGSTKSSQPDPNCTSGQVPSSFTQQIQQCSRRPKGRPHSRLLSPNLWEPQSPIYATPPHSPMSDVGGPYSPLTLASFGLDDATGNTVAEEVHTTAPVFTDPHFTRDTHMRIILGNSCSGVGQNTKSSSVSDNVNSSRAKPRRNGIVTNPALRLMPGRKNGVEESSSRKKINSRLGNSRAGPSGGAEGSAPSSSGGLGFHWRKETPL